MAGLIVSLCLLTALVGLAIGNRKGRAFQGFVLGLLLSVIGVLIVAFLPPTEEMKIRRAEEKARFQRQRQRRVEPLIRVRRNRGKGKDLTAQ
jgi:uncharacterized transporter YbjL